MKSKERKIIVLSDLKSRHFDQAFFVLKDGREENRSAVFEAERIVEEYFAPAPLPARPKKARDWDFIPFAVTAALAVLAGIVAVLVNVV